MMGYVSWREEEKGRAQLCREEIGGEEFAVLTLRGREGGRLRRQAGRAARKMRRRGVRQAVFPAEFPLKALFEAQGIRSLSEQHFRCALLEELLEELCREKGLPLRRLAAAVIAERTDERVWRGSEILAQQARFLILSTGEGWDALSDHLRYVYGVSAGPVAPVEAAVGVYFTDLPEYSPFAAILCLGPRCGEEQTVACEVSAAWRQRLGERELSSQLLAALFAAGRIQKNEIKIKSIALKT